MAEDFFSAPRARTVIEEDAVSKAVEEAIERYPQAGDMFNALVWRIARDPRSGAELEDTGKWIIKLPTVKGIGNPVLVATYTFDEDEVVVDWVKYYDPDENGSVSLPAYVYKQH